MQNSSYELELNVLCSVVMFPQLQNKVELMSEQDFCADDLRRIFLKIRSCFEKYNRADAATISSELDAGEKRIILDGCEKVISIHTFDDHFKLFKEMSQKRNLTNKVYELVMSGECDKSELRRIVDETDDSVLIDSISRNEKSIEKFLSELNKPKSVVLTGFDTLDTILGGVRQGSVFILGARPSTGKTSLALNIASNNLRLQKKVMFFSLEMSAQMIYERLMAEREQIEYSRFGRNKLTDSQVDIVRRQMQKIKSSGNLQVIDDIYAVEVICNQIAEFKPDLAVVDFIQIVDSTRSFRDVRQKIDYISTQFKRIAKRTGCTVLVLSQLSRAGKDAPTMSDLKESGGLEQDGDYIALLHRPYILDKTDKTIAPEKTVLNLDKNKFGRTGVLDLWFDLKYQKFVEIDNRYAECVSAPPITGKDVPF